MNLKNLRRAIRDSANEKHAKTMQWFFKTGKGEYGEGDKFVGIKVPVQRQIAKKFLNLKNEDLKILLDSKIHEERLIALLILVDKYQKAIDKKKYICFM